MDVAKPAAPAFGKHDFLIRMGEIREQRLAILIINLRTDWHFEHHILGAFTVTLLAHAMPAACAFEMLLKAIIDERIEPRYRLHDNACTTTAIAAIRPALGNKLLPPEADTAFPAIAGLHVDFCFINKFHNKLIGALRRDNPQVLKREHSAPFFMSADT